MKLVVSHLLLLLFISCSCKGQGPWHTDVGDTVMEMHNDIMIVFQDRNNNYWFGSNAHGAYRYDGKTLLHYTTQHGLADDKVRGIQEDKKGNIYFNTGQGRINKFDGKSFTTLPITQSTAPDKGWKLQAGDLWFKGAQDSGVLYRYDGVHLYRLKFPKTKYGEDFIAKFPRANFPRMTFSPYDVYSFYKDKKGVMWIGTEQGLCRYDGKAFAWMTEKELGIDAVAFHVRSTIEDKNGDFWFSNTMHRFDVHPKAYAIEKGSIAYKKEKGLGDLSGYKADDYAYFLSGLEDSNGHLWLVTYNKGVWRYDGKTMTQYPVRDGDKDVTLFTIYKDNRGYLWLGTHESGAYTFNGKSFQKFIP